MCVIKLLSRHLRNMLLVFSSTFRKLSYASEMWNRVLIRSCHVTKGGYFGLHVMEFDRCQWHQNRFSSSDNFLRGINRLISLIRFSISVTFGARGVHNTVVCESPDNLRKEGCTSVVGVNVRVVTFTCERCNRMIS